jgi:VIT1/CCC1 family predicted Fe2+/Mn2+ transporter
MSNSVRPYSKKLLGIKAERIRDQIFGATDGTISTLAVIAGVAGATANPFIILVAGASAMLAEAISMGFSSYSAAKTKEAITGRKIARSPVIEGVEFWLATMGGGFVPLLPFLFLASQSNLVFSVILSAIFLFAIGTNAARMAQQGISIPKCCLTGLRTAVIGLIAAAITYAVGLGFAAIGGPALTGAFAAWQP